MATKQTLEKRTTSVNNYIALMAGISLMAILVTGFIVNILGRDFIMNTKVIVGKQKAIGALDTKIENANSLMDEYRDLGSKKDLIEHALPNTTDFPQIVTIINNSAQSSGVRVKALSPKVVSISTGAAAGETQPQAGQASAYKFGIDVEGSYSRVRDFIRNLELSARPIRVDAITIRGNGESLTVSMRATTYYQAEADLSDKKEPVK